MTDLDALVARLDENVTRSKELVSCLEKTVEADMETNIRLLDAIAELRRAFEKMVEGLEAAR